MRTLFVSALMAGFALSTPALADDAKTDSKEKVKLSRGDKKFIKKVMEDNNKEVANAQLALQKSQNDDVKKFAQRMVDDHTKAGEQLRTLCSQLGADIDHKDADKAMKADKKLEKADAAEFDKKYMEMMVKEHKKDLELFEKQAKKGDDAQVREFAQTMLTTLHSHHEMASTISSNVKNGKSGESVSTGAKNPGTKGSSTGAAKNEPFQSDQKTEGTMNGDTGVADPGTVNKGAPQ